MCVRVLLTIMDVKNVKNDKNENEAVARIID